MNIRAFSLLCFAALLVAQARADEPAFDVLHYYVRLNPDFETQSIAGQSVIFFRSTATSLRTLSFSANSLDVTASIDGEHIIPTEVHGDRRLFHLPYPLRRGDLHHLVVTFKGRAPKGLVFGKDYVYANYFTCDYMICDQDRPGDKATIFVEIITPIEMHTIAPGLLARWTNLEDGTQLNAWDMRRPMSPYLLGFAAGHFTVQRLPKGWPGLEVWSTVAPRERMQAMFSETRPMLEFFEKRSGVRAPGPRYTQILVEGGEAQEAATHSIIGLDNIAPILENPHEDWVIAHELAHQWWGNAVTCANWSELWLNEGLTVFMVAAWKEQRWGRADYDRELELANKRWGAAKTEGFDVPLSWQGKYPSLKLKRAMAYAKAVIFLDTLRRELGEDAFWRGIENYTRTNWDKAVHAQDLQRALERASKRDLSALFAQWVYGAK